VAYPHRWHQKQAAVTVGLDTPGLRVRHHGDADARGGSDL